VVCFDFNSPWFDYLRRFWLRWLVYSEKLSLVVRLCFILCTNIIYGDVAKCVVGVGVYERRSGKIKFENRSYMKLSIIFVNWNTRDLTRDALVRFIKKLRGLILK